MSLSSWRNEGNNWHCFVFLVAGQREDTCHQRIWESFPTGSHIFLLVAAQAYHVTVPDDSVIVGNDAVIRCNIPSFVTDFLSVTAWVTSEGSEFQSSTQSGINSTPYSLVVRQFKLTFILHVLLVSKQRKSKCHVRILSCYIEPFLSWDCDWDVGLRYVWCFCRRWWFI